MKAWKNKTRVEQSLIYIYIHIYIWLEGLGLYHMHLHGGSICHISYRSWINRMVPGPFRGIPIQSQLLWLTCVLSSDLSWQAFGPDLVLMLYPESLVQNANVSNYSVH